MTPADPEALLAGLDPAQVEAVRITRGPLVVHAGAGSGKTRVVSHRVAYAVATGAVDPRRVLVVTFTDKAAGEMVGAPARRSACPGIAARTFHAAALAQLRHFWPLRHDGEPAPAVLDSKIPIVGRLARGLPGGYRFTTAKDLADEIEWAKSRRLRPATYASEAGDRTPPIPVELFVRLWADYEREKDRAGRLDFDDMLTRTVDLLEADAGGGRDGPGALRLVQRRRVPGHEPAPAAPPRALARRPRRPVRRRRRGPDDLHVRRRDVGVPDGLRGPLPGGPRGDPGPQLPEQPGGPRPRQPPARRRGAPQAARGDAAVRADADDPALRRRGGRARAARRRRSAGSSEDGTPPAEIAVLVRINAQVPPLEAALTKAGIAFRVRGQRFFERPEVREALRLLRRLPAGDARAGARRRPRGAAAGRPRLRPRRRVHGRGGAGADGGAGAGPGDRRRGRRRRSPTSTPAALLAEFAARARGRGGGLGRRREPADAPPGEGARVGRGLPPRAGGGDAADPPGGRRRRGARGGAAAPLRRPDARPPPPGPLLGRAAGRVGRSRIAAAPEPVPARARGGAAGSGGGRGAPPGGAPAPAGRASRVTVLPGPAVARPPTGRPTDEPLMADLRAWRLGARPGRRRARLRRRPRRAARRDRGAAAGIAGGPAPGQGDGPGEARALRRGDPRDRGAPLTGPRAPAPAGVPAADLSFDP